MLLNCGVGEDSWTVPWAARRSNQSILKEISPEYSLEGLMLKLKLQYSGHPMQRTDSLEKTRCWERLKAGGEGDDRGWDGWMASLTRWTWVWVNSGSWWWTGRLGVLQFMGSQRVGHDWATEQTDWLTDWLSSALRCLEQWFTKYGSQTSIIPRSHQKCKVIGSTPDPLKQELFRQGPHLSPGDFDEHSSLRTTALEV